MKVNDSNVVQLVEQSWEAVRVKVENGHPLSSEKSLVFLFSMELVFRVGSNLKVDFENQCYSQLTGKSKYLDLLFYTNEDYLVALEFKLPRKSAGGASNQPETREAIYRDIGRLNYLKSNDIRPKACFFLMAANEAAYLNTGNYTRSPDFLTSHNTVIDRNNMFEVDGASLSGVDCVFEWVGITKIKQKYVCDGLYSWLKPIKV